MKGRLTVVLVPNTKKRDALSIPFLCMPKGGLTFSRRHRVCSKKPACSLPQASCLLILPVRSALTVVLVPNTKKRDAVKHPFSLYAEGGTHFLSQTSCLLQKASLFASAGLLPTHLPYSVGAHCRSRPQYKKRDALSIPFLCMPKGGLEPPQA